MQKFFWQYKYKSGWKNFNEKANRVIDRAQAKGCVEAKFAAYGKTYVVSFTKMECRIVGEKKQWSIRRLGGLNVENEIVKKVICDVTKTKDKRSIEYKTFMPPHHLVYKLDGVSGMIAPTIQPQANIGVSGTLVVMAVRARNLHNTQGFGNQSPYIRFSLEGEGLQKRRKKDVFVVPPCKSGGVNPVWNYMIEIPISSEDRYLRVSMWNKNMIKDDLIGRSRIPLNRILPFVNPEIAFFHMQGELASSMPGDANGSSSNPAAAPKDPAKKALFFTSRKQARAAAAYSLRSWFQLAYDFGSRQDAGELLIDFRFIARHASKIRDWDDFDNIPPPITRSGPVFGATLEEGVGASEVTLPRPVYDCVEYLDDFGLEEEGLFRIPGDSERVAAVVERYNKRLEVNFKNPNCAAGVLKQYFRDLKEPLVPYKMFMPLISILDDTRDLNKRVQNFKVMIAMLSPLARHVLSYLLNFLSRVTACSGVSKMSAHPLAVCWAPSLLRTENSSDPKLVYLIPKTIAAVEFLIQNSAAVLGKTKVKADEKVTARAMHMRKTTRLQFNSELGMRRKNERKTTGRKLPRHIKDQLLKNPRKSLVHATKKPAPRPAPAAARKVPGSPAATASPAPATSASPGANLSSSATFAREGQQDGKAALSGALSQTPADRMADAQIESLKRENELLKARMRKISMTDAGRKVLAAIGTGNDSDDDDDDAEELDITFEEETESKAVQYRQQSGSVASIREIEVLSSQITEQEESLERKKTQLLQAIRLFKKDQGLRETKEQRDEKKATPAQRSAWAAEKRLLSAIRQFEHARLQVTETRVRSTTETARVIAQSERETKTAGKAALEQVPEKEQGTRAAAPPAEAMSPPQMEAPQMEASQMEASQMEASQMEASQMEAPQAAAEKLAAQASNKGDDDAESNDDPVTASNRRPRRSEFKRNLTEKIAGMIGKRGPAGGPLLRKKVPPPPRVRKKPPPMPPPRRQASAGKLVKESKTRQEGDEGGATAD